MANEPWRFPLPFANDHDHKRIIRCACHMGMEPFEELAENGRILNCGSPQIHGHA